MKNDPFFKYVAIISIVGVFIALFSPSRPIAKPGNSFATVVAHVAQASEQTE